MRKTLFLSIALSLAGAISLHAQSIKGTSWKLYIDELHDTLTLHIKGDSSFVTDGSGEVVVRSLCKISKDTISMKDIDGKYVCPDQTGVYIYAFIADTLTMTLVNDPCDNRSNSINGSRWMRAKD
ncbi:MAG: hypothetical protein BGO55_25090 [Sphingobacteriales bacterium 50-39]|nr:hypothetical protein [Sphingobacteriales bacterium]OJW58559.1 MAG: hypothetical protein BGO55_25090 [Sphingobacteriales bacterium 50-39]